MSAPDLDVRDPTTGQGVALRLLCREVIPELCAWPLPRPERPFWRLYWNAGPGMAARHLGRRHPLDADRVVLVAPGTHFIPELRCPTRHRYAHFLLGDPFDRRAPGILVGPVDAAVRARLASLFAAPHTPTGPRTQLDLLAVVAPILAREPPDAWPRRGADRRIEAARGLLDGNPHRRWRNAELAAVAGLTPNAFTRRFRQMIGVPPQTYLQARRMDLARIMLEHGEESIDRIAETCGFATRSHFSTVFKRAVGVGPATYRREARR